MCSSAKPSLGTPIGSIRTVSNSEHTMSRAMWAVVDLGCQSVSLQGSDFVAYLDAAGDRRPRPMDFSHPWDAWLMCLVSFHQPIL